MLLVRPDHEHSKPIWSWVRAGLAIANLRHACSSWRDRLGRGLHYLFGLLHWFRIGLVTIFPSLPVDQSLRVHSNLSFSLISRNGKIYSIIYFIELKTWIVMSCLGSSVSLLNIIYTSWSMGVNKSSKLWRGMASLIEWVCCIWLPPESFSDNAWEKANFCKKLK